MLPFHEPTSRRRFLTGVALAGAYFTTRGAFAEELTRTPAQTEGPFYPDKLPLDTDNDLLIVNDGLTPGVGEITHLHGKILDAKGNPVRNALVEICSVTRTVRTCTVPAATARNTTATFRASGDS